MNILNIGYLPFKNDTGKAEIIRTNFIIRGLKEKNNNVTTYSYDNNYSKDILENHDYLCNKHFYYLFKNKSNIVLFKFFFFFFINPFTIFYKLLKHAAKYDIILIDRLPFILTLPVLCSLVLRKKKYIIQLNEFIGGTLLPHTYKEKINLFLTKCANLIMLRFASGVIVISSEHKKYYQNYTKKGCKYVIIPMLIEYQDKKPEEDDILKEIITIGYGGTLNSSNGISLLVEAVEELFKKKINTRLVLFGPSLPSYHKQLSENIAKKNLQDKILIFPEKNNTEAIKFIHDTIDILVIPKLNDHRARGYIPSKLGDYLYSGKPVLVSNVGEMSSYIKNNITGYIIEPDDIFSLTSKLEYIIQNYADAQLVGKAGKKISEQFEYRQQVEKLINTMLQLL